MEWLTDPYKMRGSFPFPMGQEAAGRAGEWLSERVLKAGKREELLIEAWL
jgi:hypothetical protein